MAATFTCANCGQDFPITQASLFVHNPGYCRACYKKFLYQNLYSNSGKSVFNFYSQPQQAAKMWYTYPQNALDELFDFCNVKILPGKHQFNHLSRVILFSPIIESFDDDTFSEILEYGINIMYMKTGNGEACMIFIELKRRYDEWMDKKREIERALDMFELPQRYMGDSKGATVKGIQDQIQQGLRRLQEKKEKEK